MSNKRIFIYSHDTYGLGHLRRSLAIADRLVRLAEHPTVLVATGSPRAGSFDLPRHCDVLKLPCITKHQRGRYAARDLCLPLEDLLAVRSQVLLAAARAFAPDVILVDHAPVGVEGELKPLLDAVGEWPKRPIVIAGLRDIIDEVAVVRREWTRLDVWSHLERCYDRIFVYGDKALPTTAEELELDRLYPQRVESTGYLARRLPVVAKNDDVPMVLVTVGGGGDGQHVLRAFADHLHALPEAPMYKSVVVTGPLLSRRRRTEVQMRFAATNADVEVIEFTSEFESLLARADAIISMGGYNSVVEALAAGKPTLVVPREKPRMEQRIRAERLERLSDIECCPAGDLSPQRLRTFIDRALAQCGTSIHSVSLEGLDRVATRIQEMMKDAESEIEGHGRLRTAHHA